MITPETGFFSEKIANMTLYTGLSTATPDRKLEAFFGISIEQQQRVGTIVMLWSMVEMQVELLCWVLGSEQFEDGRPATDRLQFSQLYKKLDQLEGKIEHPALKEYTRRLLVLLKPLSELRHGLAHGVPLSKGQLVRNPSILGETRSRPSRWISHSIQFLDCVAKCADTAFILTSRISSVATGSLDIAGLTALDGQINEAQADVERLDAETKAAKPEA